MPGALVKLGAQQSTAVAAVQPEDKHPKRRVSRRITIETSTSGQQYVSIQRSRSGKHHHSPHHHHHHDYVKVARDVWDRMVERDQTMEKTNQGLICEIQSLKSNLCAAQTEVHRLSSVVIPQLECQIAKLVAENQGLRRDLENTTGSCGRHHAEIEALRIRIGHQDKELKDLRHEKAHLLRRVEGLLRQINSHRCSGGSCGGGCTKRVEDLQRDVAHWKDKFFDMQDRRNALSDLADVQERKMRTYEEILRRHGLLCR